MSSARDIALFFMMRVEKVRSGVRKAHPDVQWVEATDGTTGTYHFYFTAPVLLYATDGKGTREIRLERPQCSNCNRPWRDHVPGGGKCLFGPTDYDHVI